MIGGQEKFGFEVGSGIVSLILMFSIFANGLAIAAISYATYKKKEKFIDNWNATTIFILNLAFADLMRSLLQTTYMFYGLYRSGAYGLWSKKVTIDDETRSICKFYVLGLRNLSQVDGWSIAIICLTRIIPNIK